MNLPPPNKFLESLSREDFELLGPNLRDVRLEHFKMLFDQGDLIQHLYFPYSGVISFVVPMGDGAVVEAGMIGRDGLVGAPAALDGAKSLNRAIVQAAGDAFQISLADAKAAVNASATLRERIYRHDQLLMAQAQQSAACNAMHDVPERLARWLLRSRDVLGSDQMKLTQDFLSQMLGVRRTSVTIAARQLQSSGMIKYRRGRVEIVDVDGLQEASCECYQAVKRLQAMFSPEVLAQ
jgi:CRP-like cAMP-binding protein